MNKLEEARCIINSVDGKMIELFKKRMEATEMVASYKKENNLPILDELREKLLIESNVAKLNCKNLEEYYLIFFNGLLEASKKFQRDLNE